MMYTNPSARNWKSSSTIDPAILPFHKTLPNYGPTPLHPLPQIARELGVANVLVKDESHRFGLPAYKILGASWAVYRTVTRELCIPATASLADVKTAAQDKGYEYYTATDGNWGRAVARMASMLGAKAHVYVPKVMLESTKNKIAHEGAEVIVIDGDYDDAVMEAEKVSKEKPGFFITDMAWEWYTKIPQVSLMRMCSASAE
jgi:diaminopropionate ammonia-lyase